MIQQSHNGRLAVEPALHQCGDRLEQFGIAAGPRQGDAVQVVREVEVRVVDPFRRAQVERVGPQDLPAARD